MAAYVVCVCDVCCVEGWAIAHTSTQHTSQTHKKYAATWQQCSFYKYFKHFKNWITATQRGNKWGNPPDDGLKESKHVGLFIKSVLSILV